MTYSEFKDNPTSEKITLAVVYASKRLMGWTLDSGSVYKISDSVGVISDIKEDASSYTAVASKASVTASTYYHDKDNGIIYAHASDGSNPNGKFISMRFKLFFSSAPVTLPHDLSSAYEVYWEPSIRTTSRFGVEVDTVNQTGEAIEGSGTLSLYNDQDYWQSRFDKYYFENHPVQIYSYNRDLDASEAKLLFKGKIQSKTYSDRAITFRMRDQLSELRAPLSLADLQDASSVRIPDSLNNAKQRLVIGRVSGLRPVNVDQVVDGYPLTGTVSASSGSATVTGSSTQFLKEVSPDDRLKLSGTDYTVASVSSDTSLTLTENYSGDALSGGTAYILPDQPKRWLNREFLIAGHALREPQTTVSEQVSNVDRVKVSDVTDIQTGDKVYIGTLGSGEVKEVSQIIPDQGILKFTSTFASAPTAGTAVRRPCVQNVRINDIELTYYRDYTVNASTARLTLSEDAEKNAAPIREMGSVTFTSGSATISGSGFEALLKPGYVIRAKGQSAYFEILSVDSDTSATLRENATYSATATGQYKTLIYDEGDTVLSLDVLGCTEDGTKSGVFVENAPQAVQYLLKDAGLTAIINTSSFTEAQEIAYQPIGMAVPERYDGQSEPSYRDMINRLNKSVFGSLIQDSDFKLKYGILRPHKPSTSLKLREEDVLGFRVSSTNHNIVQKVLVNYGRLEYYYVSGEEYTKYVSATSDTANYILETGKQKTFETVLANQADADIYATRWAFLLERATNTIRLTTKLQAVDLEVNDIIDVEHRKLFERLGGTAKRRLFLVEKVKKSGTEVEIEAVDLSNAFNRVACITSDASPDYANSGDERRLYAGFITDEYGMIDNDSDTFGSNVIW